MTDRIKAAEYLLDEIGGVDDSFLHEAMIVHRRSRAPKVIIIAATLMISMFLILGTAAAAIIPIGVVIIDNILGNVGEIPPTDVSPEVIDSLDTLLLSKANAGFATLSHEELPTITGSTASGGKAYLVWQYEGEDEYVISEPINANDLARIEKNLGRGDRVGEKSPSLKCRVWIILPSGEVKSPYLENTSGNTGKDTFDYEAEIYPTEEFLNDVSAILD